MTLLCQILVMRFPFLAVVEVFQHQLLHELTHACMIVIHGSS
ncbi:hypothetical protein GLYMA_12G109402v4 [Glycine max]|nr:hypothetical protein GLYMA_12G109402v4 [Glycine max]KAH1142618.1 hypothetical protein GYH30_033364 [Glycine max]